MQPELLERRAHLVVAKVEDVLAVGEKPVAGEQGAELSHLVPEDREVPVIDVEVVVLDVGEDGACELETLVEDLTRLAGQQRAVPLGDRVTLGEHGRRGAERYPRRPRGARCTSR